MSTENIIPSCPICGHDSIKVLKIMNNIFQLQCERCGIYFIEINHIKLKRDMPWDNVGHLVSAWIKRQNRAGIFPTIGDGIDSASFYSADWWSNHYSHMGFPETTNEKLNVLLLGYADIIKDNYKKQISYGLPQMVAEVAAKDIEEVNGLTDFLKELGYIDEHPRITVKGWQRIDELRKAIIDSNSAFIALWFDDSTKNYRESVIAAIEHCGYDPLIVDQQEYNGFIMDQVISLIKKSRFLVADFTALPEVDKDNKVRNGVRGGVYWEAGMAYGLGRQVIHTCKDSLESRRRIHFDVDQYNTIFWKDNELSTVIRSLDQTIIDPNFSEKLATRILATVGRGNNISSK